MAVLGIDFDGVIHDAKHPLPGKRMGAPIEGALQALARLRMRGDKIIIFSVKDTKIIKDWMDFYQLPYDDITNQKPDADVFLDDKAIRFENWDDAMKKLSTQ